MKLTNFTFRVSQRSVIYSNNSSYNIIRTETADSNKSITFKLLRSYNQGVTLSFNSPNIKANTNYTIYTGGTDFHGRIFL